MTFQSPFSCVRILTLLIIHFSLFAGPSLARYVEIRQATTPPTQASANNDLCATPNPTTESTADAALDRGVPFFLNDVLTEDFLPNNGYSMVGWLDYIWTKVDTFTNLVVPDQGCSSLGGEGCDVYAQCNQVMELFWTQNTITNFHKYIDTFDQAFTWATGNISDNIQSVNSDFPIQVPTVSETTFFNNFGAALSVIGGGVGLFGDANPDAALAGGVLGMLGGIFSDVGSNLQPGSPPNSLTDLDTRLSKVYTQVTDNMGALLTAVMTNGNLSAYPSRMFQGSQYNNSLVAFFDNGNFFSIPVTFTTQNLLPLLSDQLLANIVGAAVLEANYYILKDAYAVADCPAGTNLTGAVLDNSCFTLEVAGQGTQSTGQDAVSARSSFSNQMDPITAGKLGDSYHLSLSDLYTSSYSCQNANNAYGATVDLSNLDLNMTAIPPCFYNLPVFQVTPPTEKTGDTAGSPCAIFEANSTAKTPAVGLTFLPDNLSPIFTEEFCKALQSTSPVRFGLIDS